MLAGRALLDEEFLHGLVSDPQYAANQAGIHLSDEQASRLKAFQGREKELYQVIEQIRSMRQGLDEIHPAHIHHVAW